MKYLCFILCYPFISPDYDDEGEDPTDTFGDGDDVDTDYIAQDKRACDTDKERENADEGHEFHVFCPLQIADECIIDGKAKIDNTLCVGCGVCEQLCKFDALKA